MHLYPYRCASVRADSARARARALGTTARARRWADRVGGLGPGPKSACRAQQNPGSFVYSSSVAPAVSDGVDEDECDFQSVNVRTQ